MYENYLNTENAQKIADGIMKIIPCNINMTDTEMCIRDRDKPVGGILVFGKTKEAAGALSKQISEHQTEKRYLAVVCGKPVENFGTYVDYLWKDGKNNISKIVDKGITDAKRCV